MAIKFTLVNEPLQYADCINCGLEATQGNFCEYCLPTPAETAKKPTEATWDAGNIVLTVFGAVVLAITAIAFWGEVK